MHVGICRFTLLIVGSHSLKEKRSVVRRLRTVVADRLGVTLAEVGGRAVLDSWQRADLAFATVSDDHDRAEAACHRVLRMAATIDGAELGAARLEVAPYGDDWFADAAEVTRAAGLKLDGAGAEDDWIPEAWRREAGEESGS